MIATSVVKPAARRIDDAGYDCARGLAQLFLRRLQTLCALTPNDGNDMQGLISSQQHVASHRDIVRAGDRPNTAMVLLSGLAGRYRMMQNARRQITGFLVPGDICDAGFLASRQVTQSLMAFGPVTIGHIKLEQLSIASARVPNLMIALMRSAALETARSQELAASLGVRDAAMRLAHFLCELHYRLGSVGLVGPGNQFGLPLTQGEIGEALGLSTVHVNRTIQNLRRRNLLIMAQGTVSIPDVVGLAQLAEFNADYLASGISDTTSPLSKG